MRDQLLAKLRPIFRDVMDDSGLQVKETTAQTNLRAWDSMAQVTLVIAIESAFNVAFTAKETGELISVSAILDQLESKLGKTHQHV